MGIATANERYLVAVDSISTAINYFVGDAFSYGVSSRTGTHDLWLWRSFIFLPDTNRTYFLSFLKCLRRVAFLVDGNAKGLRVIFISSGVV